MAQESGGTEEKAWDKTDSRRFTLMDRQTGEVMDALPILVPRRHKLGTGFFMGIQDAFISLAKLDLSHDACRVLFYLLGRMEYENHVRVGQSEIVRELKMHKSSVSRALKRLTAQGVLKPTGEKVGRSSFYKVDTELAWRGKARNRPRPRKKQPQTEPDVAAAPGDGPTEAPRET